MSHRGAKRREEILIRSSKYSKGRRVIYATGTLPVVFLHDVVLFFFRDTLWFRGEDDIV